jgi:cytochrome bd-type quinol oxidase subunit 2
VKLLIFGLAPFAVISACHSIDYGYTRPTTETGLGTLIYSTGFLWPFFWLVPICSAFAGVLCLFVIGRPVSVVRRHSIARLLLGAAIVSCLALVAAMILQAQTEHQLARQIQFLWGSWAMLGADLYAIAILTVVLVRDGRQKA